MVNKILFLIAVLILIPFISGFGFNAFQSNPSDLGTFKQEECVSLFQSCTNCTNVNITSVIQTGINQTTYIINRPMTSIGADYNYTFCNTTSLGIYKYTTCGTGLEGFKCETIAFKITPTGDDLTISLILMYALIFIILISLFVFLMFWGIKIPYKNERNNNGEVIKINWKKYLKLLCIGMAYAVLVWISFTAWSISNNYLSFIGFGLLFKYIFTLLVWCALPIFVFMVVFSFLSFISDKKFQSALEKGLTLK